MTTILNLICSICSEEYGGARDEVVSTYCGHIFHNSCYQDWRQRSATCPECRAENSQTHRVYLHIENPTQRRMPSELQVELENKISQLEHQLAESENNFFKLQETQCGKEEEMIDLKTEIECQKVQNSSLEEEFTKLTQQFQDCEKNILSLLQEIDKSDIIIKEKQIEIDFLKLQNKNCEGKIQELKSQNEATAIGLNSTEANLIGLEDDLTEGEAEIIHLSTDLNGLKMENHESEDGICCESKAPFVLEISLRQTIRILEEKLRQTSLELEKEISDSTALTVENMKLRNALESCSEEMRNLASKFLPSPEKTPSM